jgi:hypothetical protein
MIKERIGEGHLENDLYFLDSNKFILIVGWIMILVNFSTNTRDTLPTKF